MHRTCVLLVVLVVCIGGLVADARAVSKACQLIPATHPGAEQVLSHNIYQVAATSPSAVDLAAADAALATLTPINVLIATPTVGRNLGGYGIDQPGVTYRVQIAAVNANGQGPRSDIQSVTIDAPSGGGGGSGPVPSKAAFSIVCP